MRRILKSYVFWNYPRGSLHYDVMVTLILVFIFLSPFVIDFRDRPQATLIPANGVLVKPDGAKEFTYDFGAKRVEDTGDAAALKARLLERVETISGAVEIDGYSVRTDARGHVVGYRVWAHRPAGVK